MRVRNLPILRDRTSRQFVCACTAGGPSGGVAVTTKALLIAPSTMLTERLIGSPSSARGALEESVLNEEWLVDLLERAYVLTDGCSDSADADGAPVELLDDRLEDTR